MKKKIFSFVLTVFLALSCFSWSSLSANSLYVRKVVSIVYDDSGSMSSNHSVNWSYTNYAVQTLCGLLNADDELYITYMSNPGTSQSAVTTAQNKLVERYGSNRSSGIETEYWLIVLSDGEFNEKGVFGKAELDTSLQSFSQAQISDGMDTPVTTATPVNPLNPSDKTVYKIIVVPEGFTVDRDDLSGSLDSIRPVAAWPTLFYPTGQFTVTGTLNNTISKSTVIEITSVHLFRDIITVIWPLFIIAYLVFYLTRKRFSKAYLTRKIYFIADTAVREGSKSQVFVKPSTGWLQLAKHACTQKYAYLTFAAAKKREVTVRYHLQKPIDYQVAPLTDNLEEIEKIFTNAFWKTGVKFDKSIRISESTALYIRTKTNISVYYVRAWQKRATKRSKVDAASSNNEEDVMYMYEQGDNTTEYNSIEALKRDAAGIVTGTVLSANPIFRNNILHTLTEVSVDTVYSGPFSKGDVIFIEEHGGQVKMEDYIKGTELENEAVEEIGTETEKTSVVVGIDGYYPIPVGRHVLLFLQDEGLNTEESDQKIYTGLGGYYGIFYQQSDKYTYINPMPDASGVHASLEVLCKNRGRLSVTAGELCKKKHE